MEAVEEGGEWGWSQGLTLASTRETSSGGTGRPREMEATVREHACCIFDAGASSSVRPVASSAGNFVKGDIDIGCAKGIWLSRGRGRLPPLRELAVNSRDLNRFNVLLYLPECAPVCSRHPLPCSLGFFFNAKLQGALQVQNSNQLQEFDQQWKVNQEAHKEQYDAEMNARCGNMMGAMCTKKRAENEKEPKTQKKRHQQAHVVVHDVTMDDREEGDEDLGGLKRALGFHLCLLWLLLTGRAIPTDPEEAILSAFRAQFKTKRALLAQCTSSKILLSVKEVLSAAHPRKAYSPGNVPTRCTLIEFAPNLAYLDEMEFLIRLYNHIVHHYHFSRYTREINSPGPGVVQESESNATYRSRRQWLGDARLAYMQMSSYDPLLFALAERMSYIKRENCCFSINNQASRSASSSTALLVIEEESDSHSDDGDEGQHVDEIGGVVDKKGKKGEEGYEEERKEEQQQGGNCHSEGGQGLLRGFHPSSDRDADDDQDSTPEPRKSGRPARPKAVYAFSKNLGHHA
ncbi:hypothetical protein FA13DRAFT_1707050 [Coprinellus micaceus]|uniref:Uncharacterized protein n=1 Tax=Coprinellus micaceus TaxID=71717 RepID=A0A4Y7TMR2_COPMI|nr:hypothetical protein FA13DRAFT_1707050 [Coprinellus micaceus]